MKSRLHYMCVLLMGLLMPVVESHAVPPLPQLGQMLTSRYDRVEDLSAKISFTGWTPATGSTQYDGRIYFLRPDLFRIDYTRVAAATAEAQSATGESPQFSNILVKNSSGMYRWDPPANAWVKADRDEDQVVGLLAHVTNLTTLTPVQFAQYYNIQSVKDARVAGRSSYQVAVSPKPQARRTAFYAYQSVDFDAHSLLPLRVALEVPKSRKIQVEFEKVQVNRSLPRSVFGME